MMKRIGEFSSRALDHTNSPAAPPSAPSAACAQEAVSEPEQATRPTKLRAIQSRVSGKPRLLLDAIRLHAVKAGKIQPRTREEYLAHWNVWANGSLSHDDKRSQALTCIVEWMDRKSPRDTLNLSDLGLTSLPDYLPASLKTLSISNNNLTALPDTLPPSLEWLFAPDNQLSCLPVSLPDTLELLWIGGNNLTRLPDNLPDSITDLCLPHNRLTNLPDKLPAGLIELNVDYNQLRRLPETLPASMLKLSVAHNGLTCLPDSLPPCIIDVNVSSNDLTHLPGAVIEQMISASRGLLDSGDPDHGLMFFNNELDVCDNPFPEQVIRNLYNLMMSLPADAPRIHFSMLEDQDSHGVRPLPVVVGDWFEAADREAVMACWAGLAAEAGASDFSNFLSRLQSTTYSRPDTENQLVRQQFRQATAEWLTHLAQNPSLRAQSFLISHEASTSCEDRVSLFLNLMKKARVAADVESGRYDTDLPSLMGLAKSMFRLDQLEVIAREKVESLRFVDEVEVYLAYQVKLRDRLQLQLDTPDMRYFNVSYVTLDDLDRAEVRVLQAEKDDFIGYLSTQWQPWQSVLKRIDSEAYEAASERLINALGSYFSDRLHRELKAINLENDLDAQRGLGAQLKTEITRDIKVQLTQTFIATHGLTDLLP